MRGHHRVKYSSGLLMRSMYGGIYTSDLVLISLTAFIISRLMHGFEISLIYMVIALTCIPLYLFLIAKNQFLPKLWPVFEVRSSLRARKSKLKLSKDY